MARYVWDEKELKLIKISDEFHNPDHGLNGPVWFPKGGHKYFDKALQRTFHSKEEKRSFMKEHNLRMEGNSDKKVRGPEAGLGKTYYSIPGLNASSYGYKHR